MLHTMSHMWLIAANLLLWYLSEITCRNYETSNNPVGLGLVWVEMVDDKRDDNREGGL